MRVKFLIPAEVFVVGFLVSLRVLNSTIYFFFCLFDHGKILEVVLDIYFSLRADLVISFWMENNFFFI